MKIHSIHLQQVGPLRDYDRDFTDEWKGGIHDLILLSGVNGSGKSTVLRAVAHLWTLTGKWLSTPGKAIETKHPSRHWLGRQGGLAVILEGVPVVQRLGLFFGDPALLEKLQEKHPGIEWMGETYQQPTGRGRPPRRLLHEDAPWLEALAEEYRRLILNGSGRMPNMIHLDGEERRWVQPRKGTGEVVPDDPQMKWLTGYRANEEWKGQLEASLIALKTLHEKKYSNVIHDLNQFLKPKKIEPQPNAETLRLQVKAPRPAGGGSHTLDDLSAGEHQILIQIYLVSRWLNPGGVVMIDEPDLHLHPSLLNAFLSRLETLVKERDGQLILTSHNPDLWERYENKGLRVQLGGEL